MMAGFLVTSGGGRWPCFSLVLAVSLVTGGVGSAWGL
jgi:hypothetical protein